MMQRITLALVVLLLAAPATLAEVTLPSVFGDHMVLQRDTEVRIWGKAEPGEGVHVGFHIIGSSEERGDYTEADRQGDWHIMLPAQEGGVKCRISVWTNADADANKKIVFNDVLFGEVWVASGQSNMAWTVRQSANASEEIKNSKNDQVRMWTARRTVKPEPASDVPGRWAVASPETTGEFSAVAYYFARKLQKELGVPVGILHASWGGTPVEAWTSRGKLDQIGWAKPILERYNAAIEAFPRLDAEHKQAVERWQQTRNGPANTGFKDGLAKPDFDDSKWQTMKLPQGWEQAGLNKDGVVWFRKTIDLPDAFKGRKLRLELGPIDDGDTTYVNNKQVGQTPAWQNGAWQRPRVYDVPAGLTKQGKLAIAVRAVDTGGGGGIYGKPEQMKLRRADGEGETVALAGDWKYHFAHEINAGNRPVRPPARPFGPDHPHSPAGLFNGMIAPITPYTIRGAIWYQGESNASRAQQYKKLFPGMIEDWRARWGQGDFPFLFVQLANYRAPSDKVEDTDWAHLRDAQLHTLRTVKNTGMAVTIDIGEANDIHPRNKQDVGKRLARWALGLSYGRSAGVDGHILSGPIYSPDTGGFGLADGRAELWLQNFGSGLSARQGGNLNGFTIAGKDRKFVKANAEIKIQTTDNEQLTRLIIWSDQVKDPVAVRYAWEDNPDEANLMNEEGLPASPFRTDDWQGPTDGRR